LSDANEARDWRIWADFAQVLIRTARDLYAGEDFGLELDQTVYALDSSTIDLCRSLFPWATFRKHKGGIKIHALRDVRGSIPRVVFITDAKVHEVNILDELVFEPGAIYLMDRAYVDFARLYTIHLSGAFFITRTKSDFPFKRGASYLRSQENVGSPILWSAAAMTPLWKGGTRRKRLRCAQLRCRRRGCDPQDARARVLRPRSAWAMLERQRDAVSEPPRRKADFGELSRAAS